VALAKVWEMFDDLCGQRPKPMLLAEVDRLSDFGELRASNRTLS